MSQPSVADLRLDDLDATGELNFVLGDFPDAVFVIFGVAIGLVVVPAVGEVGGLQRAIVHAELNGRRDGNEIAVLDIFHRQPKGRQQVVGTHVAPCGAIPVERSPRSHLDRPDRQQWHGYQEQRS